MAVQIHFLGVISERSGDYSDGVGCRFGAGLLTDFASCLAGVWSPGLRGSESWAGSLPDPSAPDGKVFCPSVARLRVCPHRSSISQPGSIALPFLSEQDWRCLTMVPAVPHRHDLIRTVAIAANSGFSWNARRSAERFCLIGSHDVTVMECASFRRWLLTELGCAVPAAQTAALSDCRRSQLCCETQSSVERFNLGAGLFSLLPSSLPPTSTLWR